MPSKDRDQNPSLIVELALLGLLALVWGASYTFVKVAVATITPITLVAVRVLIAAVLLWFVARLRGHRVPRSANIWCRFLVQGCFNSIVPFTMITWGQQFVDSGLAGILNSTSPIFVFLITIVWTRHEPASFEKLFGAIIGLGGVALVIGFEALHGLGRNVAAQAAIVLATVCYAMAAIHGRRFAGIPPEITAAGTMTWAAVILVPASLVVEDPASLEPSRDSMIALVLLAVFSTAGAFVLYFRLVDTLGSMGVASVSYLRAGVSVGLGILFLDELLTWTVTAGLVAVVIGVAAINGQLRLRGLPRKALPARNLASK